MEEAPAQSDAAKNVSIFLPLPNGERMEFFVFQTTTMHPNLATKYPMIQTFKGYSKDKTAKVHLDITTKGLHAIIDQAGKSIYIDPYAIFQDKYYISYYAKDLLTPELMSQFKCGVNEEFLENSAYEFSLDNEDSLEKNNAGGPVQLRTYRAAIACTGEFTAAHGGTIEDGLSAIVVTLNRLNLIFERDLAIHMELVEDNDQIVYFNGDFDPFTNGDTDALIDESQEAIDNIIGFQFYDIGHVFSMGFGNGLAQLGGTCTGGKARAASTTFSPVNNAFATSLVGHEMGHQLGAQHTMSSCGSIQNINFGTAYEPGSGTTIMSYAGVCGAAHNIQGDSDGYYFTYSLTQIFKYTRDNNGDNCSFKTETGNTNPDVNIPIEDGFYIPINTPFEMIAEATDAENDNLTYCWEQMDLGPFAPPGQPEETSPLFRSFTPTPDPQRIFPRMEIIVNNSFDRAEVMPPYSRELNFRCTVRDNNINGGGVAWDAIEFEATETAGPFLVESPNEAMTWQVGDLVEVKWDVANTTNSLVNCQAVDILLSLDGGYTYPIVLAENTNNDGSDFITVPNEITNQARVKIKASNNIFFDISNTNFDIAEPTAPSYALAASPNFYQVCLPEVVAIDISTASLLGFNEPIDLSIISGVPNDAMASLSTSTILPSESSQLFLDFSNVLVEDTYEVVLQAVASNADTILRSIVLTTVSNNFTALSLGNPSDGNSGVEATPSFDWVFAEDANFYKIQLATNPSFAPEYIIDEASNLTTSPYDLDFLLDENTLYYWRILPYNECGEGQSSKIFAFHTQSITCKAEEAIDVPIVISSSQAPTLETKINVFADGTISDINISQLKGSHEFFSDLRMTLTSPSGKSVLLFDGRCANYNGIFNITLDDEAPVGFSCPPIGTMRPQESLSAFIGESTKGDWILTLEDKVGGSAGGTLEDWSIEFCTDINLSNPQLIRNELMPLPPAMGRNIDDEFLYAEDNENLDWQLNFTLVENVKNGQLFLDGTALSVGDQFNQGNITWGKLRYVHDGSETDTDSFDFTIIDGEGGWTGTHTFNISIDENVVVSAENALAQTNLLVYPNPASKVINISTFGTKSIAEIRVFNTLGELVKIYQNDINQIDISTWSKGIYIIQAKIGEQQLSQKISVL